LFEQIGIPVIFLNTASEKFSGMTVQTDINMPIIFLNKNLSNDHKRFTLAHELGHLIMHIPFADDPEFMSTLEDIDIVERQANRFAGAFLMPEKEIKRQMLNSFTYSRLTEFKLYWKVSKQSVIHRAKDLGVITPQKFTNLFVELSRNGERKRELLDVPIDEPRLFKEVLNVWETDLQRSKKSIAEEIGGINLPEFQDWLGIPKSLLRVA
jgi:Zn-dependent peptidase ImmA (M78 family)